MIKCPVCKSNKYFLIITSGVSEKTVYEQIGPEEIVKLNHNSFYEDANSILKCGHCEYEFDGIKKRYFWDNIIR